MDALLSTGRVIRRQIRHFKHLALFHGIRATGYGKIFGTHRLEVHTEAVAFFRQPNARPIRLVHLSDFHASPLVPYRFIERAIDTAVAQSPDLICLTGDYISNSIYDPPTYRRILRKLADAAPTFASFGNHDGCRKAARKGGYLDPREVGKLLKSSGIRCLFNSREQTIINGQRLMLVGLGDLWSRMMSPATAFQGLPEQPGLPIILLSHNPDSKDRLINYPWRLMLCGHTHGGQLKLPLLGAPFAPVKDKQFVEGLHRWQGRWIHITRGIGNVLGIRINCRPQVSILELMPTTS